MATKGDDSKAHGALDHLYERWTLDVLPELAPAAAALFAGRPQRFKQVGQGVSASLARFHYRTGHDEDHLDDERRRALLAPLLGDSDGRPHTDEGSEFHRAAAAVRRAAADFVQRSEDTGEAQMRAAFRDALTTFQRYLTGLQGAVVDHAVARTRGYFDAAVGVFQDRGFAGGFGLPPASSGGTWPFGLDLDGDGAVLVEEIGIQGVTAGFLSADTADQQTFIVTQRIGHFGRLTIGGALAGGEPDDERTDAVIGDAYRWWTALRELRDGSAS